jgi:hypothetical protein
VSFGDKLNLLQCLDIVELFRRCILEQLTLLLEVGRDQTLCLRMKPNIIKSLESALNALLTCIKLQHSSLKLLKGRL